MRNRNPSVVSYGWAVIGLGCLACMQPPKATSPTSAGSVAIARDGALVYAVDTDNSAVEVVDTASRAKIAEVKVGTLPERVVVGPDEAIYVSNRGSRTVSVFQRGDWEHVRALQVGVEPVGLAVTDDTLYVVNGTSLISSDYGTVMAFDVRSLTKKWELDVGAEPRGIALLPSGRGAVSLFKAGDVAFIDLATPAVIAHGTDLYQQANASWLLGVPQAVTAAGTFHARGVGDVVATTDGARVYAPVVWAREGPIGFSSTPSLGYYANGGPCSIGAVVTPGVLTFEGATGAPLVDDLTACSMRQNSETADFPPSTLGSPSRFEAVPVPIQGPSVVALDPSGEWIFVANRETNNVAVLPANRRSGDDLDFATTGTTLTDGRLVSVGAGPSGIAISADGKTAYVYSSFDHSLSILEQGPHSSLVERDRLTLTSDVLDPSVVAGRKLFYGGADSRMTNAATGTSCASCHFEGREDGHVWQFPDGPRQTPSLAGRMMGQTAPYHWSGEFATMSDFLAHTVALRMGGSGIDDSEMSQVADFINALPSPDNAQAATGAGLNAAQQRGAQLFHAAQCDQCHAGAVLTNNGFADVGTLVVGGNNPDDAAKLAQGFNVPSLLNLARTAPYLHDGSAASLDIVLTRDPSGNRHGLTAGLTDAQRADLVEYLKTL